MHYVHFSTYSRITWHTISDSDFCVCCPHFPSQDSLSWHQTHNLSWPFYLLSLLVTLLGKFKLTLTLTWIKQNLKDSNLLQKGKCKLFEGLLHYLIPLNWREKKKIPVKSNHLGASLVAQWLRTPANAGDMGSSPGPGRSHMLRSN